MDIDEEIDDEIEYEGIDWLDQIDISDETVDELDGEYGKLP